MEEKINKTAEMITAASKIVIFTGAGISTESGIPDFRGPGGIWTKVDPEDFTINKYLSSSETRKKIWHFLVEGGLMFNAEPNPGHYAIVELEKMNKLSSVITQNVDNLHQRAGNNPEIVHELHGNMRWLICLDCRKRYPVEYVKQNSLSFYHVPTCEQCQGILKPDVVLFGEALPQDTLRLATQEAEECDLLIVIGSSLVVYPAAYMPLYAKRSGADIVIINVGPTEQDQIADIIIDAPAGKTMTKIVEKLKPMIRG